MRIEPNHFKRLPSEVRQELESAFAEFLATGSYILGSGVEDFEHDWALTCGAKHAVGVANGMDALELSLRACGLQAGDEVLTTGMTAFATTLSLMKIGAVPRFADIDPTTALIAPDSVPGMLTEKTKAILLVHLYGRACDMGTWEKIAAQNNLFLIEDCAQAHMAKWAGRAVGTFGQAGAFSFYPTKNLGAFGDAGAIVTNDDELAVKVRALRNYGQTKLYQHEYIGLNSRLDEIQARLLKKMLPHLGTVTAARRRIAKTYRDGIKNEFVRILSKESDNQSHVYHQFVICSPRRDELRRFLSQRGIATSIHYPIPTYRQVAFASYSNSQTRLKHTDEHASQALSLPVGPYLESCEVEYIVHNINLFS
jgi:dTDP-4-amino-4,6-dideoxygalactose transaminase